jgi:hypothetical protein
MAKKFSSGLYSSYKNNSIEAVPKKDYKSDGFLLLLLLFILLAASPSLGLDSGYFFIIIMTIIGLGGVDKSFGLNI